MFTDGMSNIQQSACLGLGSVLSAYNQKMHSSNIIRKIHDKLMTDKGNV